MTDDHRTHLDDHGYVVLERAIPPALLHAVRSRILELLDEEGERAGHEFRTEAEAHRLANLVDKGEVFRHAIALPTVLEYVRHVLGPAIKLSSLNARSADPRSDAGQPLHVDMAAIPDERGYWVCNTIWLLDDFTVENGATRMIPGSHRWGTRPQDVLEDPCAPHPDEILLVAPAGSLAVMNAHMWHGGTANRSNAPRLAMHAFYCRRDKPQQQYQKRLLRPETQAALSPELRDLLALDDPLNDELSARVEVRSGFLGWRKGKAKGKGQKTAASCGLATGNWKRWWVVPGWWPGVGESGADGAARPDHQPRTTNQPPDTDSSASSRTRAC